jgi:S1-C subfamily serine protease
MWMEFAMPTLPRTRVRAVLLILLFAATLVRGNADTVELAGLQDAFERVARDASPSIVAIAAVSAGPTPPSPLQRLADLSPQRLKTYLRACTHAVGTGFVIDADGYVVTNEHVVAGAKYVWAITDDGRPLPAIVVGSDPRSDLAVLKVPAQLPAVKFADGESSKRGQWTITLGNPIGLAGEGEMAISVGVVSAINRSLSRLSTQEGRDYFGMLQTTAEVNPGNSGGPLLDLQGRVIGVVTAVVMPNRDTNGIGFAIPVSPMLLDRIARLKRGDEIEHGYLGVMVSTVSGTRGGGVLIDNVEPGSPAASQLRSGDIVRALDEHPVNAAEQFIRLIGHSPVDRPLALKVRRGGNDIAVQLKLRPRRLPGVAVHRGTQRLNWQGAELVAGEQGVVVTKLEPNSVIARAGVREGATIASLGNRAITNLLDLLDAVADAPDGPLDLKLQNANEPQLANIAIDR